ncbi:MAG TPA: GNAT family N-acetyltransferase [Candidatus Acidoferrum sp.]|nr:GNAT family N-acetyltransferase [Candidatus Acidoferrum sp.]
MTARLVLRKPTAADAEAIYTQYSGDTEVTKYVGWPRHQSIEQTKTFLAFSDAEWNRWPAGPYLIERQGNRKLLGGTGLAFETPTVASTGYVLARDAWGHGYATEALAAVVVVAHDLGVQRSYALCHANHPASIRVLEKCGFVLEDRLPGFTDFPNLGSGQREDCLRYVSWQTAQVPSNI